MPASVDSCSAYPLSLSLSAVAPSGLCTSRGLASRGTRILTPRVARAAHWRSLNRDAPTSDVLCHRTGTTRRLQAASPLPPHVSQRASDSPAWSGPPRTRPVKGEPPMTQDAFRRVERLLRSFTFGATQPCAWFREELFAQHPRTHSPSLPPPTASVSTGHSVFRTGDFVLARSCLDGSSCDLPRCMIEMRPTDFCHPSLCLYEHPYSSAPGSSSGLAPCV